MLSKTVRSYLEQGNAVCFVSLVMSKYRNGSRRNVEKEALRGTVQRR